MDDLISKQAVIDAFWSLDVELRPSAIDAILNRINGLPSAQPDVARDIATILENELDMRVMLASKPSEQPEIIRCKDCKWFNDIGCAIEIVDDSDRPRENDFCSFAERKDNELV